MTGTFHYINRGSIGSAFEAASSLIGGNASGDLKRNVQKEYNRKLTFLETGTKLH